MFFWLRSHKRVLQCCRFFCSFFVVSIELFLSSTLWVKWGLWNGCVLLSGSWSTEEEDRGWAVEASHFQLLGRMVLNCFSEQKPREIWKYGVISKNSFKLILNLSCHIKEKLFFCETLEQLWNKEKWAQFDITFSKFPKKYHIKLRWAIMVS